MAKTALASVALVMATAIQARMPQPAGPVVRVVVRDLHRTPLAALCLSKHVVATEFAAIGVAVRFDAMASEAVETIEVEIVGSAPASASRDALAQAVPYSASGTRITIFSDRLAEISATSPGRLLGYVLAHEIAHVLQRVARHSAGGILKAHWETSDYGRMGKMALHFEAGDAGLIRANLEKTASVVAGF